MRRSRAALSAVAALALLAGCSQDGQDEPEGPTPTQAVEEAAQAVSEDPEEVETEVRTFFGGVNVEEDSVIRSGDDWCMVVASPELGTAFRDLEESEVVVRDADSSIVGTTEIERDFDGGEGCSWQFSVDVPIESKFYTVEIGELTSPVIAAADMPSSGSVTIDLKQMIVDEYL